MNCVVCLCIGDKYSDDYVIKLQRMVSENTTRQYKFMCFSDRIISGVNTILIEDPTRYRPVWYKLWLLQHGDLSHYDKKVFFDLDVVIQNNIDWVFDVSDPALAVIDAAWKPETIKCIPGNTGYNSSIMVWAEASDVWDAFRQRPEHFMNEYKGMDRFLWNEDVKVATLPENHVYSFREGATLADRSSMVYRPEYSVCIFNQHPKPHTIPTQEPVKSFWI